MRPASTSIAAGAKDRRRLVPVDESDSDADVDAPWIHVDKRLERRVHIADASSLFEPGDAFDVAIDSARCLPDSVTLSKVTIAALHANRTQIATANGSAFAVLDSDVHSPSFDLVRALSSRRVVLMWV